MRKDTEVRYAAQAAAVMADSVPPKGAMVAQGMVATFDATKFVQARAEYPSDPIAVASESKPNASNGMAKSVGIAA